MNEEVLIPKMTRIDKTRKKKIKIPAINLVLIFFAILLYICSTFINLNIKHYVLPANLFSGAKLTAESFIYSFFFIPQVPVVLFAASVLGKRMAVISVILYLLAGLAGMPLFALGGGIKYIAQFGFGYLAAYIPAVIITCRLLKERYSFSDMVKAAIAGVLVIHVIGILYMAVVALFRHAGFMFVGGWIAAQSGLKIIYDILFSFVLIVAGKYIHSGLSYIIK